MLFNSMQFAIFFPIAVMLYFIIPNRFRNVYLLLVSYIYYMSWEVSYAGLLLVSTLICYVGAHLLKNDRTLLFKRGVLFLCVFANLFILFIFKYFDLFVPNNNLNLMLPVGISFYIFKSISFIMDIYRGKIVIAGEDGKFKILDAKSEVVLAGGTANANSEVKFNFVDYALYVSFFPQLVAGPIERAPRFFADLYLKNHDFDYERVRLGLFRMLWGFFLKLVISERLAISVNMIYDNFADATGYQLVLGTFLYAFQIYTDFYSYSEIAIGASKVLGFDAMENFRQPFFAKSCRELWQRWHVSLNSWFVDYVYIPLGGSKKGSLRKYINVMVVFILSGLWHGADLSFVVWGALSGGFQVAGELFKAVKRKGGRSGAAVKDSVARKADDEMRKIDELCKLERVDGGGNDSAVRRKYKCGKLCKLVLQIVGTFICFNIALVFFRADNVEQGLFIFKKILFDFNVASIVTTSPFALGLGVYNMLFLCVALVVLFVGDLLKEKGLGYEVLFAQKVYIRWGIYFLLAVMILMSAHLGAGEFIYFKF